MKVAVLGCGGIIGQYMMVSVPAGIEPLYVRRSPSALADALDLTDWAVAETWLNEHRPEVIVNLAGESRPDEVERAALNPDSIANFTAINTYVPVSLAKWCDQNSSHLIQVGTQASFTEPGPSGPPANHYGYQKDAAESWIKEHAQNWTIVRPTFVLGIRPFPGIGRENPAESILNGQFKQVNDRFFSVSFAWEVAETLWMCAQKCYRGVTLNIGSGRFSRYDLARAINPHGDFAPVAHSSFEGLAPRGYDTHYTESGGWFGRPVDEGFARLRMDALMMKEDGMFRRALELAAFLRLDHKTVENRLVRGFGFLHGQVAEDYRKFNPQTEDELLAWYRTTEAYLWELTAYHCDAGFNYSGQCRGIIEALKSKGVKRVLNLGDGVGTLTIKMREAGLLATYHDLALSRTESFSTTRYSMRYGERLPARTVTDFQEFGWFPEDLDAVVSLDFLEHIPTVEEMVRAVFRELKPGGYFVAQNGFNCGSGPDGSIPMHLACNDRYEKDWDPLLKEIGFVQLASNWYQKPA